MGKKGRIFEYRDERDADLMKVFNSILSITPFPVSLPTVLEKTVTSPSKRFWVSSERASNVISAIRAGDTLSTMNENKRLMFLEINRRVIALQQQEHYRNMRLSIIVSLVVEQPAPCFYITPESAKVIIHHIKKRCRQKSKQSQYSR